MPSVTFLIDHRVVPIDAGEPLLSASLRAGIPHAHACGGNARCSTCRVSVVEGINHCSPRNDKERALADRLRFAPEVRLACQTTVTGDVTLRRLVLDDTDIGIAATADAVARVGPIGEERQLAIMFADIRGFTPFAESLMPYDVVHALNRYYDEVGRVIVEHHGRIDNYMGDGLLALFGLEEDAPIAPAARNAVNAAHAMVRAVERLQPYFETVYGRGFDIGIGIHVGELIVGAVGATGHRRITVVGDAVNVAARIEAATKPLGVRVLISTSTLETIGDVATEWESYCVTLPGKSGEFVLHAPKASASRTAP